ncbi:MAG TPA: DUF3332 family protein [Planctomycetota bacterium]|nr:DUF3332 family protein [Planctomycetota bacterium]
MAGTLLLVGGGCYGPFKLTCKVHEWNGRATSSRWGNEAIFFGLAAVGVYGLCAWVDALVFNSIEWWGGRNPMDGGTMEKKKKAEAPGRSVSGSEDVAASLAPAGNSAEVEPSRPGG